MTSVLAVISNTSACELYRIFIPFKHLDEQGYQAKWVSKEEFIKMNLRPWDIIVLPRTTVETEKGRDFFFNRCRSLGKVIIWETDDDLFNILPTNPSCPPEEGIIEMKETMKRCDLVTVSTSHLKQVMEQYNPNVKLLQNYIDPDIWIFHEGKDKLRIIDGITVGIHGGWSHYQDWAILANVFPRIAELCPEVTFVVAGYQPDYIKSMDLGKRLVYLDWVPIEYYPGVVAQIDIGLCPLVDDEFNRSKSYVKVLEHSMCGAPSVVSPTVYGDIIVHGQNGLIAKTEDEWVDHIHRLVKNKKLRKKLGYALRDDVLKHYNIHNEIWRWAKVYNEAG